MVLGIRQQHGARLERYALASLFALLLVLVTQAVIARELTASDVLEVKSAAYRLVAPETRTLGLTAFWGEEEPGKWSLEFWSTVRPVETIQGLCSMERHRFARREGDADFRRLDSDIPLTWYWRKPGGSCDVAGLDQLPDDAISAWPRIPTNDLVRIMDNTEQLLRIASDAQCSEPVMARVFANPSTLKLRSLTLVSRGAEGVIYEAFFEWRSNSGPFIDFSLTTTGFEVVRNCFGHVHPMGPMPYLD